jgi:hypothetical protein
MYKANILSLIAFNRQHLEGGLLHLQEFVLNGSHNYQTPGAKYIDL